MKKLVRRTIHRPSPAGVFNITINVHIEPDELILYADDNLITHVVTQPASRNAIARHPEDNPDGTIEFKAYCNDKESVIIEISNNGPAITSEIVNISLSFFTTKEGGNGIGLSISRQIMRLSGGSLSLKNTPGTQPTTFMLIFP
ncbi:hypothetical protein MASR1M31_14430 [Porphyromonadaceae bacterium]